uniref:Uncharacterized protein n=1 Tax=Meloidogyne incognita TaxID=6306 RepID=A0A914KSB0_MELIC
MPKLSKHISEEHSIPVDIAQQLANQIDEDYQNKMSTNQEKLLEDSIICSSSSTSSMPATTSSVPSNKEDENNIPSTSFNYLLKQQSEENIFSYKCNQCLNNIAFRTEEQLNAHSLCHSPARFKLKRKIGGNEKQKIFNKCDVCLDCFDTNEALLEHFNSEKHLQKAAEKTLGGGMEEDEIVRSRLNSNQFSSTCSTSRTPSKSSTSKQYSNSRRNSANSSNNKYLPYVCNICSLSFGQPGTLDTHLRSTAHAQRIVKLNELVKSGEINPQVPVFEQPEPHPPQRSIGELLREKKKQQKMGKLTAIPTQQQPSIPSTSTTSEQNNNILDWWRNNLSEQSTNNNSNIINNFMSQIFNNDSQQKQQNDVDSFCAVQMAQIAQMMLSAQMTAAAQMASLNSENGRNGLLDLLGIKNEEETIINKEVDDNQELNKSVSPYEEPRAKKPKNERKSSEKPGNNEIKKNSQINDNSDQNGSFNQNNNYGDFASVLRALTCSSANFAGSEQSTTTNLLDTSSSDPLSSQFPSNQITSTDDPTAFLMATMAAAATQNGGGNNNNNSQTTTTNNNNNQQTNSGNQSPSTQQKRARTRIGDDHVKILRQYFDINNSPSEEQIKEMAQRTNLAEKVIKHWFRNTLFKERQRDKDSPYNFSIPPQMSIDLATYHKTGEAKIVPLIKQEKEENESMGEEDIIRNDEENSKIIENYQNEMKDYSDQELDEQEMSEDREGEDGEEEENILIEQKVEENNEEQKNLKKKNKKLFLNKTVEGNETKLNLNEQFKSIESVAADLLASIGRQQIQNNSLGDEGRNNCGIEFSQENQQLLSPSLLNGTSLNFDTAGQFAQLMFSSAAAAAAAAAGIPSSFSSFNLFNPFVSNNSVDSNINILQQPSATTTQQQVDIISQLINSSSSTQQTITTNSSSIPSCSSSTSINSITQIMQQQQSTTTTPNNSTTTTTNIVMPGGGSSGRRANRTRFTDFQLRTMQDFFDKQAYPKDDDLEMLSKKLGLSPRVIVVWFQNARQKARKVFEQQPHLMAHPSIIEQITTAEGRFTRTPSSTNFQCKVCGQVFQRYLELIQHQQRICCSVKLEEQQNNEGGDFNVSDILNGKITKNENLEENGIEEEENKHLFLQQQSSNIEGSSQEMLLFNQLLAAAGCSQQQINQMKIDVPSSNNVSTNDTSTECQCPLCGLQFNCNDKLAKHISENHFSSSSSSTNFFNLKEENNEKQQNPLDLTINRFNGYKTEEEIEEEIEEENERQNNNDSRGRGGYFVSNDPSLSPTNFNNEGGGGGNNESLLLNESSLAAALLLPSLFGGQKRIINDGINQRQRPQSQSNNSKRFRTHLTPMQVFVMKSLFHDYKTPSMQECDSLGRRIGLTKRVVQVWFQNTRAKERKAGSSSGSAEPEELIPCCGSSIYCQLCDMPFGNNLNNNNNCQLLQEHIFTENHIEKVKEKCSQLKTTIRGCSVSIGGDEQQNLSFLDEKREGEDNFDEEKIGENCDWNNELLIDDGGGGGENKKRNNQSSSSSLSPQQQIGQSLTAAAQLPYYALAAAAAGGIGGMPMNGLLPPLLYDPLLFGTPVSALKVPESVSQQIITDMSSGKGQSCFTQDGLEINKLESKLADNFGFLSSVDLEVGWGCQNCNNVFQQPELLQNHWKLICPAGEDIGAFKLIQTHYQCNPCQKKFGTQDDFCDHCLSVEHKTNCRAKKRKQIIFHGHFLVSCK